MGRHRRSAPPATEPASAPPADADAGERGRRGHRARRTVPVRTGLIGASAAVAMGTVAVASGLIPGGDRYVVGEDGGPPVRAGTLPDASPQGGESAVPTGRATGAVGRGGGRTTAPNAGRPTSAASPSASPSPTKHHRPASPTAGAGHGGGATSGTPTTAPTVSAPPPRPAGSGAEAQVLSLVNEERAKAGCAPVKADGELASLARDFSDDMAARGFFDHTDPDGAGPWERARKAGVPGLGGENIARGQADAAAVMASWMNSPGHRANILNCEYRTLGVGVHRGPGGPWWTQDFGF